MTDFTVQPIVSAALRPFAMAIIILSILGACNAGYVTYLAFVVIPHAGFTPCDISSTLSCSNAIRSGVTSIFGIPACTLALVVYPILIAFGVLAYMGRWRRSYTAIALLAGLGILMNLYLLYHEYLADTYCLLCLICGAIILTICGLASYASHRFR